MLRKKRVTISEQAQAAIASGMPVDQALAEHGTEVPAAEDTPVIPEAGAPVIDPPASSETPSGETPSGEAASPPPTEGEPAPAPVADPAEPGQPLAAAADDSMSLMIDRLQESQTTIAHQAAEITGLNTAAETLQVTQDGLLQVAIAATNRMQIGLGGTATDLSGMTAENVLAQYKSTLTTFEKRLPVGGKAEVPVDGEGHDRKVVPLVPAAVARATQIRKQGGKS